VKEIEIFEITDVDPDAASPEILGPVPSLDSQIISEFPDIFKEFRGKHFKILSRGSEDGFSSSRFHRRCDGYADTLTIILDTDGNIFGGYATLEWESGKDQDKKDKNLKSFLFTLKNPRDIPASQFPLKPECNDQAICCRASWGPHFKDIEVYNCGNKNH
jgi:hypothetical protein